MDSPQSHRGSGQPSEASSNLTCSVSQSSCGSGVAPAGAGSGISVSVVSVDYYLGGDAGSIRDELIGAGQGEEPDLAGDHAPVIRIFGCSERGQKACVHVHGVLPYFYCRPTSGDAAVMGAFRSAETLRRMAPHFRRALQSGAEQSMRADDGGGEDGRAQGALEPWRRRRCHVVDVSVVSKLPFYGFHSKEEWFLKVTFLDPKGVRTFEAALLSGQIMQTVFQPYETHIPYLLQFFMDRGITGMGLIKLRSDRLHFRPPAGASAPEAADADADAASADAASAGTASGSSARTEPLPTLTQVRAGLQLSQIAAADLELSQDKLQSLSPKPRAAAPAAIAARRRPREPVPWHWRQTTCPLELDAHVTHISNRPWNPNPTPGSGGTASAGGAPEDLASVPSLAELWAE